MTGKPIEAFGRDTQWLDGEATKAAVRAADAPETIALTQSQQAILDGLSNPMQAGLCDAEEGWKGRFRLVCRHLYSPTIIALEMRGLIDRQYYLTDLGLAIREALLRTTLLQANRK